MRLRRLLAAASASAAAAAAAISVGSFATIPTAGAAGQNPNIVRVATASYVGPYSSNACQRMNVSGGTAYVDTSLPYINIDVLGAGTPGSCPEIVSAFLNTDVRVVLNADARLLTLTGTADLSGYTGLQTVTLSYQAVGTPSHSVNVQPPGPGISIGIAQQSECIATLTISNAEGQVEATYSSSAFPDNYSDCYLVSGIGSTSSN